MELDLGVGHVEVVGRLELDLGVGIVEVVGR
jgi:hypothetical protein